MPEGRMLSKSIATSEQVASVSLLADYLFTRMIPHLDCEGRMPGAPRSVRAIVCPLREDVTTPMVADALRELHAAKLIVWYTVEREHYVAFPKFQDHQRGARFDREAPSRFPGPPSLPTNSGLTPEDSGEMAEDSREQAGGLPLSEVKLSEVKGTPAKVRSVVLRTPRPPTPSWATDGAAWWVPAVGSMTPATLHKTLAPFVALHGWPAVFTDLQKWVAERKAGRKLSPLKWYADTASTRLTAPPAPPIVDEHGCLTPYGERITRPDKVPA